MTAQAEKSEGYLDIISRYVSQEPVDVRNMARELGIRVVEEKMGDDESGCIQKTDSGYKICVNKKHSENRKRFTIAHELGHFMLHDELIGDGIFDNKLYRSDASHPNERVQPYHETQANKFAANILMPAPLIAKLKESGKTSTEDLAEALEVSEQAMAIRLSNLK